MNRSRPTPSGTAPPTENTARALSVKPLPLCIREVEPDVIQLDGDFGYGDAGDQGTTGTFVGKSKSVTFDSQVILCKAPLPLHGKGVAGLSGGFFGLRTVSGGRFLAAGVSGWLWGVDLRLWVRGDSRRLWAVGGVGRLWGVDLRLWVRGGSQRLWAVGGVGRLWGVDLRLSVVGWFTAGGLRWRFLAAGVSNGSGCGFADGSFTKNAPPGIREGRCWFIPGDFSVCGRIVATVRACRADRACGSLPPASFAPHLRPSPAPLLPHSLTFGSRAVVFGNGSRRADRACGSPPSSPPCLLSRFPAHLLPFTCSRLLAPAHLLLLTCSCSLSPPPSVTAAACRCRPEYRRQRRECVR